MIKSGVPAGQPVTVVLVVLEFAEVVSPPPITLAVLDTGPGQAPVATVALMVSESVEPPTGMELVVVHVTV